MNALNQGIGEYYDSLIKKALGNKKVNQTEVISLLGAQEKLQNVDFEQSVAIVSEGELVVQIIYGNDQKFIQSYSICSKRAQDLFKDAGRMIADEMWNSFHRHKVMEEQLKNFT